MTDEINPADWELRQQAKRLRSGESHKGMAQDDSQARQDRVEAKAQSARTLAENLIAVGSTGLRGVVKGTPPRDSGERQ